MLSKALLTLAEGAERRKEYGVALDSYDRLIAKFPENPAVRQKARRGITRIALTQAGTQEASGDFEGAIASYQRLMRNDRDQSTEERRSSPRARVAETRTAAE